ncbi:MAG: hypothetical protein LBO77_00410 [Desulfovibrio sp.]|jgi:hypothetical protein|nr:hypothetical protein [Desulfovibrio sp.]
MDVKAALAGLDPRDIDWELTPEDAVQLHMAQDENRGLALLPVLARPQDPSRYFVVDTFENPPVIRLQERSQDMLNALLAFPVPEVLLPAVRNCLGNRRGTFAPPPGVLDWLRAAMS